MPLYEYECDACRHRFEVIQKLADPPIEKCPKCGAPVHKLMSAPAFQFKGTGWYVTDYAKKDSGDAKKESGDSAKADAGAKSEAGTSATSETKSDGKSETKESSSKSEKPSTPAASKTDSAASSSSRSKS